MRRIERLINLVAALLETSQPMTADQIRHDIAGYSEAASFEAFRRMFERDKEELRDLGIPLDVVARDGWDEQPDAYIIPKSSYYLPEIDFEPDEVAALKIAAEALLGGGEQAQAGLMKLSADSASGGWGGHRVVWGADLAAEEPALGPLYSAIIDRMPVGFDYASARSGEATAREVDGYGLLHRWGNWYLVGRDRADDVVKSFRVSRISAKLQKLDGTYSLPDDFDAGDHLAGETFAIGEDRDVATVRFDPSMRWWPEQNMTESEHAEGPDGSLDVEVPYANVEALVSWLLGFGSEIELLGPETARAHLLEHVATFAGAK